MTSLGSASLDLQVVIAPAVRQLTQFAADVRRILSQLQSATKIEIKLDGQKALRDADSLVRQIKSRLDAALTLNLSSLTLLVGQITQLKIDLSAIAQQLQAAGRIRLGGAGGQGGAGAGGGGPPPGLNAYAQQLRALQGDLRSGAQTTTQFQQATAQLKAAIDAEIASLRALGPLTSDQQRRLDALRSTSGQAAQALRGVADQATRQAARAQSDAVAQLAATWRAPTPSFRAATSRCASTSVNSSGSRRRPRRCNPASRRAAGMPSTSSAPFRASAGPGRRSTPRASPMSAASWPAPAPPMSRPFPPPGRAGADSRMPLPRISGHSRASTRRSWPSGAGPPSLRSRPRR